MNGEKALAAELLYGLGVVTVIGIRRSKTPPKPHQYIAMTTVFAILALIAMISPEAAKVASAFGALVLLGVTVANGNDIIGAVTAAGTTGSVGDFPTAGMDSGTQPSSGSVAGAPTAGQTSGAVRGYPNPYGTNPPLTTRRVQ